MLDDWCAKVGRDPAEIDRTVLIEPGEVDNFEAYLEAGATHLLVGGDVPFDLKPLERLLRHARG